MRERERELCDMLFNGKLCYERPSVLPYFCLPVPRYSVISNAFEMVLSLVGQRITYSLRSPRFPVPHEKIFRIYSHVT